MSRTSLTVLYSFPHPIGSPGIGRTAMEQVKALRQLGHRCIVYATSCAEPLEGVEMHETLKAGPVRLFHRAIGLERAWRLHDRIVARSLCRRAAEIDVVHTWPQASLATCQAAARFDIPSFREVPNTHTAHAVAVVAAVHRDLGIPFPPRHSHRPNRYRLDREEAEYAAADWLLVPSESVESTFIDAGVPRAKLARHRYGCDLTRFRPATRDRSSSRPPVFVFVGAAEPRKGLHLLLDVWAEATAGTGAELVIVGSFNPAYREHLASRLDDPSIRCAPFSDRSEDVMRAADVLLLPSYEEGSALVTYEAQAAGCVLLVSDASGALCDQGVHGLIHHAGDVDSLARDLRRFAHDPVLLGAMADGVRADRGRLSWLEAGRIVERRYRDGVTAAASRSTTTPDPTP